MTDTKSAVMEALKAQLRGNTEAVKPTPEPEAKPVVKDFKRTSDSANKKSFTEIVGKTHPLGEFYFTTYEKTDWPEEVQHLIKESNPLIKDLDLDYALATLMNIEYNKPVLAYGNAGTGKSVTPQELCARICYPFQYIQGMAGLEASDFIGSLWASESGMEYKLQEASKAIKYGVYLLYDEPFKSTGNANMWMQTLMDSRKSVSLVGHPEDAHLYAHDKFRISVADNVRGVGDSLDKYAAEIQDQSTLNRFKMKVHVGYPTAEVEEDILARVAPELDSDTIRKIVKAAQRIRVGYDKGEITMPFTLRDTQEWADQAALLGNVRAALEFAYLNGLDKNDNDCAAEHESIVSILNMVGL